MGRVIDVSIPNHAPVSIELSDNQSPETIKKFIDALPFSLLLNVWGEEIYTNESQIDEVEENAKSFVQVNDVAYWPTGKAICLFFGPTPISQTNKIEPASPVNVIGKIINPDKSVIKIANGKNATFRLRS